MVFFDKTKMNFLLVKWNIWNGIN